MKKISSILSVGVAALALAGCSSTEVPVTGGASDITIAVKAPTAALSRAEIVLPEGYTMNCIMQLLDEENNTVGEQKNAVIDAATGSGSFLITAADQELAVKALFWAQYVDAAGKSVYNTADLKAVAYDTEAYNLADAAAMAATDAFCGKLDALKDGANVTLSRPFANINFVPNNPDKVAAAKNMTVAYTAPSAYNVLNGTAAATADLTFANASFDATSTPWFSTFIFAPVDATNLDSPITINLSDGLTQTITIDANTVPLTCNYQINVTATIGDVELSDITVNVGVDPGFNKPEGPKFKVGGYINAAGEPVATAAEAVGIVFHEGAVGKDGIDCYDAKFAGKTIKGYAVSLDNVAKSRQTVVGETSVAGPGATSYANGTQGTQEFLTLFEGSNFANTFIEWRTAHATTGDNVTEWYIPSLSQLSTFFWMLYPNNSGAPATGSESFKVLFPENTIFDRDPITTVYYAPCDFNAIKNVAAVRLNVAKETLDVNAQAAQMETATKVNQAALCRPMITIFE